MSETRKYEGANALFSFACWLWGMLLIGTTFGAGWVGVALLATALLDHFHVEIKRKD